MKNIKEVRKRVEIDVENCVKNSGVLKLIDIKIFRENPEIVRESEKKRLRDPSRVDEVIRLDTEWRTTKHKIDQLRQKRNQLSHQVGVLKKEKKTVDELIAEVSEIKAKIAELDKQS
ncbi:MAG: hypothetical protein ACFFC7_25460, partial [Candidatus Hermodarchaeota archaeon]